MDFVTPGKRAYISKVRVSKPSLMQCAAKVRFPPAVSASGAMLRLLTRMSRKGWLPSSSVWELVRKRCDPAAAPPHVRFEPNKTTYSAIPLQWLPPELFPPDGGLSKSGQNLIFERERESLMPGSIPNLSSMLEEPTVFVLGAGASKDYGFPLWEGLKCRMLELCKDDDFLRNNERDAAKYWLGKLTSGGIQSVDNISAEADDPANLLFRRLVGEILIKCESEHKKNHQAGWIEKLCNKLLALPKLGGDRELIENLGFINLNYDRSFANLYQQYYIEPFLKSFTRQREAKNFWSDSAQSFRRVLHPHGALGLLPGFPPDKKITIGAHTIHNPREHVSVPYGDPIAFKERFWGKEPKIYAVDELGINRYQRDLGPTYCEANRLLGKAGNVVIIGVSLDGWTQSHLKVSSSSRILTTGKDDFGGIAQPTEVYAEQLIDRL